MSYYPAERRGGCMESVSRCCRAAYVYPMDSRKLLYAAGGLVGVILVAVVWSGLSGSPHSEALSGASVLLEAPLVVGSNFLLSNLRDLAHNNVTGVKFDQNSPPNGSVFGNETCNSCQTDIPKLHIGLVGSQIWSIKVPCEAMYKDAVSLTLEQIDAAKRLFQKYQDFTYLPSTDKMMSAYGSSASIGSVLALASGHSIDGRLSVLRTLQTLGVRIMALTSDCSNAWAASYNDTDNGRLSDFGKALVNEMNRLGILIDLSEASHQTQLDVLNISKAPVVFTRAAAFSVYNNSRNIKDDVLDKLCKNVERPPLQYLPMDSPPKPRTSPAPNRAFSRQLYLNQLCNLSFPPCATPHVSKTNNGLLMVTFVNQFITNATNSTSDQVISHINYIKKTIGVDGVGIGAEFDAKDQMYPSDLKDVSQFPALFDKLAKTTWTNQEDLKKLAGGNLIRVLREAEKHSEKVSGLAVDETYELPTHSDCYSDYESRKTKEVITTVKPADPTQSSAILSTTTVAQSSVVTKTLPTTQKNTSSETVPANTTDTSTIKST